MTKPIALIDGDEYLFKATSSVEREIQWDEHNHVLYANRNEAWDNFQRLIERATRDAGCSGQDAVLCFSGERPYFRETLFGGYKGGRVTRKPLCYAALRGLCDAQYTIRSTPHLEADDVMGILATKPGTNYTIVSQDKDMQTIPCRLYRKGKVVVITEEEANNFHLLQTLMGDLTDGYSGCPSYGEKTAIKWLDSKGWNWQAVVQAYEGKGLTESDALVQARMARILRWSDWDSKRKEPRLWTPTSGQ